jgi:hypothetical protein
MRTCEDGRNGCDECTDWDGPAELADPTLKPDIAKLMGRMATDPKFAAAMTGERATMRVHVSLNAELLERALKAETEAALLRAALDAETARWEKALRLTWRMVDPLKPAGAPGSYARGQDSGIVAALTTLRANLNPPNLLLTRR